MTYSPNPLRGGGHIRGVSKTSLIFTIALLAILLAGGALYVEQGSAHGTVYTNPTFNFTLTLPPGYTASEYASAGLDTVVIEKDPADLVQVTISPESNLPTPLTPESLLPQYPLLAGVRSTPFTTTTGIQGLALTYDPAHPTQVSDVWFVQGGSLYQLTAWGGGFTVLLPLAKSLAFN